MKITFIKPPIIRKKSAYSALGKVPPIGLIELATFTAEKGHEVNVIDGQASEGIHHDFVEGHTLYGYNLDQLISQIPSDSEIIALSFMFSLEWILYKEICKRIKEKSRNIFISATSLTFPNDTNFSSITRAGVFIALY